MELEERCAHLESYEFYEMFTREFLVPGQHSTVRASKFIIAVGGSSNIWASGFRIREFFTVSYGGYTMLY